MDETKVDKVHNWWTPTNVMEVHKFLGFTGYYCYFIRDYSKIAWLLLQLTHLTTPWSWQQEEQAAFETLRRAIHDRQTSVTTTRLHQTILPTHRCFGIWCGSHTHRREEPLIKTPLENPSYTQLLTTLPLSLKPNEIMTSTSENS